MVLPCLAWVLLPLWACDPQVDSGSDCADNELTWGSWGAGFFTSYCRPCHSVDAPARYGAPETSNFDTLDEVRGQALQVRVRVIEEGTMPVGGGVSAEELARLDAFLECGL